MSFFRDQGLEEPASVLVLRVAVNFVIFKNREEEICSVWGVTSLQRFSHSGSARCDWVLTRVCIWGASDFMFPYNVEKARENFH